MKIQLNSCDAPRPDRRAIVNMLEEMTTGFSAYDPSELTDILLDGSPVEIEVADKKSSTAFRSLRKLSIDYEIMD